jgi:fatty acid desaturase
MDRPQTFVAAERDELEAAHRLVSDLQTPRPATFWSDMLASAVVGWAAFGFALTAVPWSVPMLLACTISGFALYRGLCFTHELTHLSRRELPGFETAWNVLFGVPLLLPSFTYVGVHQSHHNLSTYGTKDDPEYLPFASSRRLIVLFAIQSAFLMPLALVIRFLIVAPVGLVWPRFHQWLAVHASSFSMNPAYRRTVSESAAWKMRRWEATIWATWMSVVLIIALRAFPLRVVVLWYAVLAFVSFFNTLRVLGAHEYESDGRPRDRHGQLSDSIDTPGGPWTVLWAPVGLRYHALHHCFPGIPYHNLGAAYRRLRRTLPPESVYFESTSPSLPHSLRRLYSKARQRAASLVMDW